MLIIIILRWAIFLSFLLLLGEGIAGVIIVRRFYVSYLRKHLELEVKVEAVERRLHLLESSH